MLGLPVPELGPLVEELRRHPRLGPQVAHAAFLPGHEAETAELSLRLPEAIAGALSGLGISSLWSHQVAALEQVAAGRHVLIATPTASGKSLVFQLPVLLEGAAGGSGRALFLFPLKALGQDQRSKLETLAGAAGLSAEVSCAVYDGDTPAGERAKLRRQPPRALITNPDMLHAGILASWSKWEGFLRELKWIVVDELHVYRGLFGAHVHHVLRRLLRLSRALGGDPIVIAASATASDPGRFAESLVGEPFAVVEHSGAPRSGRHILLMRPSGSPYSAALALLVELLRREQRVIVFTKARRATELLHTWLRQQDRELAGRVSSYRAGFLPEERRRIEGALLSGELQGVIATSALELGIDIGGLDACILVGYPGSVMATWQRSGRVGRASRESLTALVALPDALDQYLLDHPEALLERPCERIVLDPGNSAVARAHLLCAAGEMPLEPEREQPYLFRHQALLTRLAGEQSLRAAAGGGLVAVRKAPHRAVNLRGSGASYAIVDGSDGRRIGSIDGVRVFHECHPGAIYLHGGRQWTVSELRVGERTVVVRRVEVEHYTAALSEKETEILELLDTRHQGGLQAWLARLRVRERVVGYERKRIFTQEVVEQCPLELPPVEFEPHGLFWVAPPELEVRLREAGRHVVGALHAAEHATISLLPLLALCDRNDLGGISTPFHPQIGGAAVFVYEGHPGGVGLAERGFADLPELLGRVRELLGRCPCDEGCPACVQSPKCGNGNRPLDKQGASVALDFWLGEEGAAPLEVRLDLGLPGPGISRAARSDPAQPRGTLAVDPPRATEVATGADAASEADRGDLAERRTVLFDVETLRSAAEVGGWGKAHRMGLAVAVVCHLEEGRFEVFREGQVGALVATLRAATQVVGFNIRRFDYQVLSGYTGEDYARTLPTLDLLDEVVQRLGHRLGLDHLARETLGAAKSADGLQSLEWVKQGRMDLVEEYCRHDVEILRDLYLFGRREGYLRHLDRDGRPREFEVSW